MIGGLKKVGNFEEGREVFDNFAVAIVAMVVDLRWVENYVEAQFDVVEENFDDQSRSCVGGRFESSSENFDVDPG